MSCSPELLAAHFEGRITPEEERTLRAHLPDCERCRDDYEGWASLAQLDPEMPSLEARMAIALGLSPARGVEEAVSEEAHQAAPAILAPSAPSLRRWAMAGGICALTLLIGLSLLPPPPAPGVAPSATSGFQARGGDLGVAFSAFKLDGAEARPVERAIHAQDGLAFAYENRAGKQHLMIFAVDAQRNVYWYHPAWTDAAQDPASVPIENGEARHELREAVRHDLTPGPLWVHAVFTDAPLTVRQVEARLPQDPAGRFKLDGAVTPAPITLEVQP